MYVVKMKEKIVKPTNALVWEELVEHAARLKKQSIAELFSKNPNRVKEFSQTLGDIYFDYSKNYLDHEVMTSLLQLAEQAGLKKAINSLFSGENVNITE